MTLATDILATWEQKAMANPVKVIKHVIANDVDVAQSVDVKTIDAHLFACIFAAKDALEGGGVNGIPEC